MIKLSIIVPIYGVEKYLRKCVYSLLIQDLPSSYYEIILVDDESLPCLALIVSPIIIVFIIYL